MRPDVVEMHDVTSRDPKLLVHLKVRITLQLFYHLSRLLPPPKKEVMFLVRSVASRSQRVGLIVIPGCPDVCFNVCLFVCASGLCPPAAPADAAAAASRTVLLLRSSSKVKAGQWVTPNPTRPTILVQIC